MGSTITIGLTFFSIIVGVWTVNLVCYHPQANQDVNPLAPINMTVAWK
ncbi:MAG: hypothetical protein WCA36_11160 [Pseudolabrys sp.]|jgi:hypothetical protein